MSSAFVQESRKIRVTGASLLRQMALERQLVAQRVGQRIARHRARLQLTQEDAAARVGVTHRAYQRWESGESMPYPRNLERVAEAFEIDAAELLADLADAPVNGSSAQLDRIEKMLGEVLERLEGIEAERIVDDAERADDQEGARSEAPAAEADR